MHCSIRLRLIVVVAISASLYSARGFGETAFPPSRDADWTLTRLPDVDQQNLPTYSYFGSANQSYFDSNDLQPTSKAFAGYQAAAALKIAKPSFSFDPSMITIRGNDLSLKTFAWRYAPSVRMTLAKELSSGIETGIEFWKFGASARDSLAADAGSFLISRPVPTATSGLLASGPASMDANAEFGVYSVDALAGIRSRLLMLDSHFGAGIRYAETSHSYHASTGTDRVMATQNTNGIGPLFFVNFRYRLRDNLSLVLNNQTAFLIGDYSYQVVQTTNAGTEYARNSDNVLMQTLQSQIGIDWTVESPAGIVFFQATWDIQEWYDSMRNSTGILGAQTGLLAHNLSFGGLAISAGITR